MLKINTLPVLFISLVTAMPASAQDERIDLDWVFSDEGKVAMALPRQAWLGPEEIMVYGNELPKSERTLRTFNPANGRRRDLVDADEAVRAMNETLRPEEPIEELGWPTSEAVEGVTLLSETLELDRFTELTDPSSPSEVEYPLALTGIALAEAFGTPDVDLTFATRMADREYPGSPARLFDRTVLKPAESMVGLATFGLLGGRRRDREN